MRDEEGSLPVSSLIPHPSSLIPHPWSETMDAPKKKSGLKGKSTLIAVGLLAVLGIWAWVGERGEVREPGQTPPVSELVGMKPDDVTRVELLHDGQPTVLAKAPPTPSSHGGRGGGGGIEKTLQPR